MTRSAEELLTWMNATRIKVMTLKQVNQKREELGLRPLTEDEYPSEDKIFQTLNGCP